MLSPQYEELGDISGEVRIDPSVNAGLAANVFTSQGMPNGHSRRFLLAGPQFVDTTNGVWAGRAETYLLYDIMVRSVIGATQIKQLSQGQHSG